MDERAGDDRPAPLRLGRDRGKRRLGHCRIMFKRHRDETIVAAHHADKTRDRARLGLQPGQFQPDIEIFRADANADHPPVTGGKMAISRASPRGAPQATTLWSTAPRTLRGTAIAPA